MKKGKNMKKLILLLVFLTGITIFGQKNISFESGFIPNDEMEKNLSGNPKKVSWFSANSDKVFDEESGKHNFQIIQENNQKYLIQWKPDFVFECYCHSRKRIKYINQPYSKEQIAKGEKEGKLKRYIIYPDKQKNIFYIKNYTDLKGEKYDKLYFGFDSKLKKIVILDKNNSSDKNFNISEILEKATEEQ